MMKSPFWRTVALLSAMLIGGCSHAVKNDDEPSQAWLEPGVRVTLPKPGITPAISSQQLLTGKFNGQTQSLLVILNADDKKLTLAGLSSVGIRLFLVTWDGKSLHSEQAMFVPQLPPASQVLADVMLGLWPIASWLSQLPKGWTLLAKGNKRELRNARGALVTEITYLRRKGKREPISIRQHAFKYHIAIQYLDD